MFFIIAVISFTYTGFTIYRYLISSFRLLEYIQTSATDTWEKLGRPEKIWIRNGNSGGMYTIRPLMPWLEWLWRADTMGLDFKAAKELKETSTLLKKGLVAFVLTLVSFLFAIVIFPPA